MAHNYVLRVTAGSSYDLAAHTEVLVNRPTPLKIENEFMCIELNVRVQNYRGLPRNSPSSSPYFDTEPHADNNDQFSIALRFTPKRPAGAGAATNGAASGGSGGGHGSAAAGISAADLQFGNDFDHPIRDRLPPGFGTAMNIVKWWVDPGLDGDVYADEPYLYGAALSSFNALHVGGGAFDEHRGGIWVEEGGDEAGERVRDEVGAPAGSKQRMKWALKKESKERWVWEFGRTYAVDFYTPYLDFNDFALRLPGFNLPIIKYWDGQPLRYVLRNRTTGDIYLIVLFTLYLHEDVNEDGSLKPAAIQSTSKLHQKEENGVVPTADAGGNKHAFDEQKALEEARRHWGERHDGGDENVGAVQTFPDDVD